MLLVTSSRLIDGIIKFKSEIDKTKNLKVKCVKVKI